MGFTVTKEFTFEAAHRLVRGYVGNCAHIHGHSWVCRVTLGGPLNALGMVRDFGDVKPLRAWVDKTLDHATLVCSEDNALLEFLRNAEQRHFIVAENPTSENIAHRIFQEAEALGLPVVAVEIDETCTSNARYEKDNA